MYIASPYSTANSEHLPLSCIDLQRTVLVQTSSAGIQPDPTQPLTIRRGAEDGLAGTRLASTVLVSEQCTALRCAAPFFAGPFPGSRGCASSLSLPRAGKDFLFLPLEASEGTLLARLGAARLVLVLVLRYGSFGVVPVPSRGRLSAMWWV